MNVFIDWCEPCLPAAARWLLDASARGELSERSPSTNGVVDLSGLACVTPGRRAGRLLLAHLVDLAGESGVILPPMTLTPGSLEPALLQSTRATASLPERRWAWRRAIESFDRSALEALVPIPPPGGPRRDPFNPAVLAERLLRLEETLQPACIAFDAVPHAAERGGLLVERERWGMVAAIADRAGRILREAGLLSPYEAWDEARDQGNIRPLDAIVLIGVTELAGRPRRLLERYGDRIRALVHAPQALADRFDALGCVKPDAWTEARLSLTNEQIAFADGPTDQTDEALRALATIEPAPAVDEVAIGLADETLAGTMARAGQWCGLAMHDATGRPMHRSAPYRLLEAIAGWLEDRRFAPFAELLRHPDLEAYLARSVRDDEDRPVRSPDGSRWIALLDEYYARSLRTEIDLQWMGGKRELEALRAVYAATHKALRPLIEGGGENGGPAKSDRRPIGAWAPSILDVVREVYSASMADRSGARREQLESAFAALNDAAAIMARSEPSLQPTVTAAEAIRTLLAEVRQTLIPTQPRAEEVEMLGWLELHLDLASRLVIIGANEGALPATSEGDPFLPDRLREALGLPCDRTRSARDAYLLEAIAHSRHLVRVIAGRRSTDNDPLSPSRLLFHCDDDALIERLARFAPEEREAEAPGGAVGARPIGSPAPAAASRFVVPDLPTDWAPPTSMSVTDFRHYLECPYRYALSRIGRLKEMEDAAREMTAGQFGDLAHGVLKQFGRDESIRDVIEEERLREYLLDQLHTQSKEMFGLSPAVQVQIVRLEDRLAAFAREQAKMRQQGWRIIHAERDFKDPERDLLMMDGGDPPMPLRATIDRIDYNEAERRCRIIDYKTGDRAKTPYEAHHGSRKKQDRWIDLQLPLYDMLARRTLDCERCELAYMLLPKKPGDTKLDIAEWTVEDLDGAISQAREVVRDIRAGRLPRNPDYNPPWDPFARICQTNVFTAAAVGDAMAGEAGDGSGGGADE